MLDASMSRKKVSLPTKRSIALAFQRVFFSSHCRVYVNIGISIRGNSIFAIIESDHTRARHENHIDRNHFCSCRLRDIRLPFGKRVY